VFQENERAAQPSRHFDHDRGNQEADQQINNSCYPPPFGRCDEAQSCGEHCRHPCQCEGRTCVVAKGNGAILPRFRNGDYAGGIKEGAKGIELVLTGDSAELAERVKGRHDADDPKIDWLVVMFWTLIILWFIWVTWRSTQRSAYRRGSGPIFLPGPGWGGGSGGSDWGGGGGFSGGGGSFGGGGASGSW